MSAAADGAVDAAASRMRSNNSGASAQELSTAKVGTTSTVESDASEDVRVVEKIKQQKN